ncbi:DNA polymerase III subunit gamma/tau [Sphingobium phenoxybenzoativorans]|uniref:DNA polymerase III subunit gamma/tau n=1 Tax=Sphingobium phenoxybenzoativorans TaxID=1592790 RepID=A0A975K4A5_9SPHN|nr:DNA polymerase III subunit gamma/tau [Sphingobium phenoxybenzoativorans]QUT04114.1 DNA polymerase III subunit gamma/tau [Sphingobium phenoxybenzoativorans]
MTDSPQPYRVLARKYRPRNFDELIGQDAMVQTLANAIKRGRLAHAFLMTGVRGVGKTSTARLIAKALNCIGPDGQGGPTIDPCGVCEPCKAIAEGRHIDVIEMDAASHTGVDDVREIIESVRYAAVSARYKIYIIDEVHMLSKNAFNALLKTLEEPPAHVKFLFATTEVNKVPVTVLSRCQRFDLRRIPAEKLAAHFAHVTQAEDVQAEPDALALIAQAAEGSARDGLSILDQAIAHADTSGDAPTVTAAQVREMLGLSDRGATRRLLGLLLEGRAQDMLAALDEQHQLGVEPLALMRGLLELVHAVTIAKAGRGADDPAQSAEEREMLADWASQIGFAPLHRIWQLLLKGHDEVANAGLPREACEMALLRIVHAASLPDPSDLARMIQQGGVSGGAGQAAPAKDAPGAGSESAAQWPPTFAALVDALWKNSGFLADQIEHEARLVRYAPPELALNMARPVADDFLRKLTEALKTATGQRWVVTLAEGEGEPTLGEQKAESEMQARQAILDTPVVRAAMTAFPDADLVEDNEQWSASG